MRMRQRLILVLMLGLASLGAECSDGGSSGSASSSSNSFAVNVDEGGEVPTDEELPGTAVPEPSAALVFGIGLVVAGLAARRKS